MRRQASFKVGYSQLYGIIVGAGLNQKNFFGTGNTLGINFHVVSTSNFMVSTTLILITLRMG